MEINKSILQKGEWYLDPMRKYYRERSGGVLDIQWAAGGGEGHDTDYCPGPKRKSVTRQAWYKMATSALAATEQLRAAPPPQHVPSDSPLDSE